MVSVDEIPRTAVGLLGVMDSVVTQGRKKRRCFFRLLFCDVKRVATQGCLSSKALMALAGALSCLQAGEHGLLSKTFAFILDTSAADFYTESIDFKREASIWQNRPH